MTDYFTSKEIEGLNHSFVDRLVQARLYAAVPFIITSGARTEVENANAQGVQNSAHLRGMAVDLACTDATARYWILNGLLAAGFKRIGVYNRHIHVDNDHDLPEPVIWWGVSH